MGLTGTAPLGGQPVAAFIEYKAQLKTSGSVRPAMLILEPTAIRGNLTVSDGRESRSLAIADTDMQPIEMALKAETREIVFRFDHPMPFDGIKVPPVVRGKQ
jgi:hypothetical protein